MVLRTNKMLFVTVPEDSNSSIEQLRTEFNTETYLIKIDRTEGAHRAFYDLFKVYKKNKRETYERLFATSKVEKLKNWINENLK